MTVKQQDKAWEEYRLKFVKAVENNLGVALDKKSIKSNSFQELFKHCCRIAINQANLEAKPKGLIANLKTTKVAKLVTLEMLQSFRISYAKAQN